MFIDQLSWEEFYKNNLNRKKIPSKISEFNRLILHSKNYFIIAGYGAFTPCYLLIVTKELVSAFSYVQKDQLDELKLLIKISKEVISSQTKRKSVVFEHGMCNCMGGLDRAHIHIMSIHQSSNLKSITEAINTSLYNRKAGINFIEFKKHKLQNIHDINHIFDEINKKNADKKDFKINGKLYKIKNIQNLSQKKWPLITLGHVKKGGHYVYFESDYKQSSFLTTNNFQTQFGREIVFNNELDLNKSFSKIHKKSLEKNPNITTWRWQNNIFEIEVRDTMIIANKGFHALEKKYKSSYEKFEIQII